MPGMSAPGCQAGVPPAGVYLDHGLYLRVEYSAQHMGLGRALATPHCRVALSSELAGCCVSRILTGSWTPGRLCPGTVSCAASPDRAELTAGSWAGMARTLASATHQQVTLGGHPEPDLIGFGGGGDFSCLVLQYGSLPSRVGYFTQFTRMEGGGLKSRGVWARPEGGTGGSPDSAGVRCTTGPMLPPGSGSEPPFEAAVCPIWL